MIAATASARLSPSSPTTPGMRQPPHRAPHRHHPRSHHQRRRLLRRVSRLSRRTRRARARQSSASASARPPRATSTTSTVSSPSRGARPAPACSPYSASSPSSSRSSRCSRAVTATMTSPSLRQRLAACAERRPGACAAGHRGIHAGRRRPWLRHRRDHRRGGHYRDPRPARSEGRGLRRLAIRQRGASGVAGTLQQGNGNLEVALPPDARLPVRRRLTRARGRQPEPLGRQRPASPLDELWRSRARRAPPSVSTASSATSVGVRPTRTPLASSASALACGGARRAGDDRAGVAHRLAGRRGEAGDVGEHGLGDVLARCTRPSSPPRRRRSRRT